MATYAHSVRRGLPRVPGGEPWPPAASVPEALDAAAAAQLASPEPESTPAPSVPGTRDVAEPAAIPHDVSPERDGAPIRRGLPRTPGGEPWPPAPPTDAAPATATTDAAPATPTDAAPATPTTDAAPATPRTASPADTAPHTPDASRPDASASAAEPLVRRGLPRTPGGDAWPPADTTPTAPTPTPPAAASAPAADTPTEPAPPRTPPAPRPPLVERPLAHAGIARRPAPSAEPKRHGPFTAAQWAGIVVLGGAAVLYLAAMAVIAVRSLLSLEPLQDFLTTYPGEYHLPEGAPVGLPAWLNWSHFLNAFFMVLIIRTGLQVRSEKRPSAFWISKKNRKRKMSLTLWLHQALDILWLANGILFVVLLFATGQWMRVIPTSWEVFPNALSAALQYISLDWPTENGWVNYNSLQQLAYFTTIFVAAPLAAITGYRMSAVWPKKATKLNQLYPVEWARALHFPTMLYFVVFIVVHVALVLSTGALRNLGHMYAAQGSVDPDAYADNWAGFWLFALSIAVTVAAYVALRPLVVAPIARLFGNVSSR